MLFLLLFSSLNAQVCQGNLGINIFVEGDFGLGIENIPTTDPGIAPGYTYTTNPPPNDGFYCLTNNIALWNQNWGWSNIGDNSNDPNGYMMVVNASFDTGLFYEKIVDGLCENTLFEFSADIRNLHNGANIIKPNVSYLIDDIEQYSSGDIPENNQWITHGFTFTTAPGQTSVKLSLRNNAPGGIGNDLAIDNITFRACGPEALILPSEIANICEDGSPITLDATVNGDQYDSPQFQWQESFDGGMTWVNIAGENENNYDHSNLAAGLYYYRYLLANDPANLLNDKCRVVSNPKIVKVIAKFYEIRDSLCSGLSAYVGNSSYNSTGIYTDSLKNYLGCDSIVTLDLTIVPDSQISSSYNLTEPSCSYSADGSISLENIQNAIIPYSISLNGIGPQTTTDYNGLAVGKYSFIIEDRYLCTEEFDVELMGPIPFVVNLGDDLQIDLGEEVYLEATGNYFINNYSWQPADILPCAPNCDEQSWFPTESSWIIVNAISEDGCIDKDSIYIDVRKSRKVYFANSFSPNDDRTNDFFGIVGLIPNVKKVKRFEIYDRWGNKVYSAKSFQVNEQYYFWDGKFNGTPVVSGVYSYYAEIEFLDEEIVAYKGDVLLHR